MNKTYIAIITAGLFLSLNSTLAHASVSFENEQGKLTIGGDVEFNVDYEDKSGAQDFEFDQNGRVLVDIAGVRKTQSGVNILFKTQPLIDTSGKINLDDAWFGLEREQDWMFKIGRYEAYDMFPVGQDTFLEYHGDSANDLYSDEAGYSYQMKEGRGRSGSAGQMMVSKKLNNVYMELSSVLGDRTELFKNGEYHGREVTGEANNSSFIVVRPVLAYTLDKFTFSLGMEKNLATDAITTNEGDVGDRTGYGFTTTYRSDDFVFNASAAYLDALNETNTSYGANIIWNRFGLGYIHSVNDFDKSSGWYDGEVEVHTWNASYEIKNILDVSDLSVFLGTYFTEQTGNGVSLGGSYDDVDDVGGRVRIKYFW